MIVKLGGRPSDTNTTTINYLAANPESQILRTTGKGRPSPICFAPRAADNDSEADALASRVVDADILPKEELDAWQADFARQLQLFPGMIPHMNEQLEHYPDWRGKRSRYDPLRDAG